MPTPTEFLAVLALATAGDPEAQIKVGTYYSGLCIRYGMKPDRAEGLKWFERAAGSGQPRAVTRLAEALLDYPSTRGATNTTTVQRGMELLRQMVEVEHPSALFRMAFELDQGRRVDKDRKQAIALVNKSAELGNRMARLATEVLAQRPDWKINRHILAETLIRADCTNASDNQPV